jgi:glycosyltransferase involved in cell wall biosynthesis
LEVLPELAARFEVAILDHGSSDATAELAHDLAAGYPQISATSYPRQFDSSAALRCGLQTTSGEMVLLVMDAAADPHDFHRLAKAAGTADAVAGRLQPTPAEGPMRGSRDAAQVPALLLFHRRVATAWRSTQTDETLVNYLLRKRYRIVEVLVRRLADGLAPPAKHPVVPPPAMHALRSGRRASIAGS